MATPSAKKDEPIDSWEDEVNENGSDTETETEAKTPPASSKPVFGSSYDSPAPPPPTPSSPFFTMMPTDPSVNDRTLPPLGVDGAIDSTPSSGTNTPPNRDGAKQKRPEKSTAVASRLIAAGIGQKAPKRTKEQREYDQAMKVQEKKKRDQAKAEEERKKTETKKAKQAIWGD